MGHKKTRHRCLVNGAANSTSLLHLLAEAAAAFSVMAFPPSLPCSIVLSSVQHPQGFLKQWDFDRTGKPTQKISICLLLPLSRPRLPDE